ncbi:NADP-dependent oxidoreductase [Sphingomonas cavernae]|uniref:NADP-dependent oxidoreductase n=1 Tax=Sphingomonas cavernae TaxID=2320861 RepID=A0A418WQF5_9SPHN|nr:NADP-dependent oxidoreductase [Sphingomonas cavernae]RJF93490.1 NADP-dependent oxidoreductase [Sphingomonas cavernae]
MARAWHLKSRPTGMPTLDNFEIRDLSAAPLGEGQVRVRNLWLSVDPYMRGRMNDVKSYVPPFQLGEPMQGGAVGEVIESNNPGFSVGDKVMHMAGWRDEAVIGAESMPQKLPDMGVPLETWLGNLGLTGATAYFGLLKVAEAKAGDIVFVSAAAGAVGSAVVQIAKNKGMTVIGSAGGADKCAWVKELGADACVDYKAGPVLKQLAEAAPKGVDVYFDNVGGEHLDAAFALARDWARFAICGMIDVYNDGKPQEMKYIIRTIPARIRMQGFIFTDYIQHMGEFHQEMGGWVAGGKMQSRETVHEGLDAMPDAFFGLFSGGNTGKMLVKL